MSIKLLHLIAAIIYL